MSQHRLAEVRRETAETRVTVTIGLDGPGEVRVETGLPFFDHLLGQLGKHGFLQLQVAAAGDVEIDGHHTVEDVGITLGQAIGRALGDRGGITRFGQAWVPLDEALAKVAVDVSGRPHLSLEADFPQPVTGGVELCLVKEFLRAFTTNSGLTLHVEVTGENSHHMAEALFKALGRALDQAFRLDPRVNGVPSTKGVL